MRVVRALARFFGWLLTPFVAWAASFLGSWFAALATAGVHSARLRIVVLLIGGASAAILSTLLWLRVLRRSPDLQEALAVHPDGTPVAAEEFLDDTLPEPREEDR